MNLIQITVALDNGGYFTTLVQHVDYKFTKIVYGKYFHVTYKYISKIPPRCDMYSKLRRNIRLRMGPFINEAFLNSPI